MPARIFTVPGFDRFARQARIGDGALVTAVERAERGLVDADLGGGLVKLRVARPGQGRSGGFRTIVALVVEHRAVFVAGFAENDLSNIGEATLAELRRDARVLLAMGDPEFDDLVRAGSVREINRR